MRPAPGFVATVLVWPSVACASFNGPISLPFGVCVAIGVVAALPGAIGILLLEWNGANRTPPPWVGALAALAVVYCVLRVTGLVGPAGDRGFYLLPIPPLIQLVLITFIVSPRVRHVAGWVVVAASIFLFWFVPAFGPPTGAPPTKEVWAVVWGAVPTTALLWQIGVFLGKRSLRRRP